MSDPLVSDGDSGLSLREVDPGDSADGRKREATVDRTGAIRVNITGSTSTVTDPAGSAVVSTTLTNSKTLKTGAGRLLSLDLELEPGYATGTVYLEILDSATIPSDGDVSGTPSLGSYRIEHQIGTADVYPLESSRGDAFTDGCVVYLSTTRYPTKTIVTGGPWAWFNAATGEA
jgi:hypothetical protein